MDWYWYVLIGVGIVGIGYLKLVVFKKIQAKKHLLPKHKEEDED